MQVRSGRIQAVDLFVRSVVRFYVYMLPEGRSACPVCAEAHGRVFASPWVTKIGFAALDGACTSRVSCQGVLIGLYGGWAEARQVVSRMPHSSKQHPVRLSPGEVFALAKGDWRKSVSADTDRISMHLLEGWCFGKTDPAAAIEGLRYVVDRAKEARHLAYVVPAALHLMGLLLKAGREDEAGLSIEHFDARCLAEPPDVDGPTYAQLKVLDELNARLWQTRSLKVSA